VANTPAAGFYCCAQAQQSDARDPHYEQQHSKTTHTDMATGIAACQQLCALSNLATKLERLERQAELLDTLQQDEEGQVGAKGALTFETNPAFQVACFQPGSNNCPGHVLRPCCAERCAERACAEPGYNVLPPCSSSAEFICVVLTADGF
jgi:hypothetical protein